MIDYLHFRASASHPRRRARDALRTRLAARRSETPLLRFSVRHRIRIRIRIEVNVQFDRVTNTADNSNAVLCIQLCCR